MCACVLVWAHICECMRKSLLLDLSLASLYQEQTSGPDGRYKAKRLNRKNNIAKDQSNEKPVTVRTKEKIRRSCFDSLGIFSMVARCVCVCVLFLYSIRPHGAHISAHWLCSLSNLNLNKETRHTAHNFFAVVVAFFFIGFSNISGEGPPPALFRNRKRFRSNNLTIRPYNGRITIFRIRVPCCWCFFFTEIPLCAWTLFRSRAVLLKASKCERTFVQFHYLDRIC